MKKENLNIILEKLISKVTNLKHYLTGAKKLSIHSDPADRENDRITEVEDMTKISIVSEKLYHGYNNKPYIKVRLSNTEEGYVIADAIRKEGK